MTAAIELERVTVVRGGRRVLDALDLAVAAGEALAVAGASGSGKTTLLRVILGLEPATEGIVRLDGREASRNAMLTIPPEGRGLAVVFQDLALWPHLTAAGNLEFGLRQKGMPRAERRRAAADCLRRVGLGERAGAYPGELSGGERQRVAIARALVLEPRAVLLDEPLANVDVGLKRELLALFRDLLRSAGRTTVLVTHDPAEAVALADRIAVLEGGRIAQVARPSELAAEGASPFTGAFVEAIRQVIATPGATPGATRGATRGGL